RTRDLVTARMAVDSRVQLLALPHQGVSATLNAALKDGSAPYVAFLDADDVWTAEKLAKQMEAMQTGEVDVCFCGIQEFESFADDEPRRFRARPLPMSGQHKSAFLGKRQLFDR